MSFFVKVWIHSSVSGIFVYVENKPSYCSHSLQTVSFTLVDSIIESNIDHALRASFPIGSNQLLLLLVPGSWWFTLHSVQRVAIFFKTFICIYFEIVHCNVVYEFRFTWVVNLPRHINLFLYTFLPLYLAGHCKLYSFVHSDSICNTYCSGIGAISCSTCQQFPHPQENVHKEFSLTLYRVCTWNFPASRLNF